MTLDDLVYIDETGYHFADYPAFLSWLQGEYRTIYGADVYIEADSQDGQWIAVQARSYYDMAAKGAAVYNSLSPSGAQGTGLSRSVKINGISRRGATRSSVDVVIVGVTGTSITDGVAVDTLEQKWDIPGTVTIPIGGTITVTAIAQEEGAVQAAANTVNRIFTPTRGWQTVNNPSPATAGIAAETDAELRARQAVSTANPSLTVFDGTWGGVANLDGVTAVRGYENDSESTDGNGLPAHSVAFVVEGGDAVEICQEIALHKTPGTKTDGTTSEVVYDAHGMPLTIRFYRPEQVIIEAAVTIAAGASYSSDYEDLIKAAVATAIKSGGIGNTVLITKLYPAAYLNGAVEGQTFDVVSITLNIQGNPPGTINVPLDFDQIPICDPDTDITVVVT